MVLLASTIKNANILNRLESHHVALANSLIEAEILQNASIKRALQAKVNETLKSFGVQEAGAKAQK